MELILNERSLHGQFGVWNVKEAVKRFLSAVRSVNDSGLEKRVWTSGSFFAVEVMAGVRLDNILDDDRELKEAFLQNIRNAEKWEDDCHQNLECSYQHNQLEYVNSSVGERTERHLNLPNDPGTLINFGGSVFEEAASIFVIKIPGEGCHIDCVLDNDTMDAWLISKGLVDPTLDYNIKSRNPPKDYQTVLIKKTGFARTSRRNQGRTMYLRTGYDQYWVVDNFHIGPYAHIEVFDAASGDHLGTSPINSINLQTKYRDGDKHITP